MDILAVPFVAAAATAILLPLQMVLMLATGLYRGQAGFFLGVGEDARLERKARRHGNLAENAAIVLLGLALAEMIGAPTGVVTGFGIAFVAARLAHAVAFMSPSGSHGAEGGSLFKGLRLAGAMGTALCGFGIGILILHTLLGAAPAFA